MATLLSWILLLMNLLSAYSGELHKNHTTGKFNRFGTPASAHVSHKRAYHETKLVRLSRMLIVNVFQCAGVTWSLHHSNPSLHPALTSR
jgi:hypothetical protein